MNTQQQPRIEETLRQELLKAGAREYEVVALCMEPKRGLAAFQYALAKGAEHPVSYAIKLFDSPEWHPSGETHRRGTNLHVGTSKPLPPPAREENLSAAREAMKQLWPE